MLITTIPTNQLTDQNSPHVKQPLQETRLIRYVVVRGDFEYRFIDNDC